MAAALYPTTPKAKAKPEPEGWVTIEEAAEHLSVTRNWMYRWGDKNGVPYSRVGRNRRYMLSELDQWAHTRRGNAAEGNAE